MNRKQVISYTKPVVQNWQGEGGVTQFEVDTDAGTGTITMKVPLPDTPQHRTVARHEWLHAMNDAPATVGDSVGAGLQMRARNRLEEIAVQAVGDAFVHAVYWPEEWCEGEVREDAVATIIADLTLGSGMSVSDYDSNMLIGGMLRVLATIDRVCDASERTEFEAKMVVLLGRDTVGVLHRVIEQVKLGNRELATSMVTDLLYTNTDPVMLRLQELMANEPAHLTNMGEVVGTGWK